MVPIYASFVGEFLLRCHILLLHFCSSNATILPAESTTISLPRQVPIYASSVGGILAQVSSPAAPFLQLQLIAFLVMAQGCKSLPISALIDIPVHFFRYLGLNFMFWGAVLFILGYISYGLRSMLPFWFSFLLVACLSTLYPIGLSGHRILVELECLHLINGILL